MASNSCQRSATSAQHHATWLAAPTLHLCLCLSVSLLFLSGCPRPNELNAKEALTQYLDKARLWAATEAQINNAIANVRRDQFVHDDFVVGEMYWNPRFTSPTT